MKKISVIIPCYNAADYIEVCMEHIINQTMGMENIEIIAIDDVSGDETVSVLKKYEEKYPEDIIIIVNENNIGSGGSRNEAVKYASGEYIAYCDADDWFTEDAFEYLYETAKEADADVVEFDYNIISEHSGITRKSDCIQPVKYCYNLEEKNIREEFFTTIDTDIVCWNKIYKKSLITDNNLEFQERTVYQEPPFTQSIKLYMSRYVKVNIPFHYYYKHEGSASTKFWEKRFDMMKAYCKFIDDARKNGVYEKYRELIDFAFWCGCYYMPMINMVSRNLFYTLDEYQEVQNMIRTRCGDIRKNRLYQEKFGTANLLGSLSYNDVSGVSIDDIKEYISRLIS